MLSVDPMAAAHRNPIASRASGCLRCAALPLPLQARLVMRQRGNLRLLLNANLWADMQVTKMEGGKVGAGGDRTDG